MEKIKPCLDFSAFFSESDEQITSSNVELFSVVKTGKLEKFSQTWIESVD